MSIPPIAAIRMVKYRDQFRLTPICFCRDVVALGRLKASLVGPGPESVFGALYDAVMGDEEIWVVGAWRLFENKDVEVQYYVTCDPETTEAEAQSEYLRVLDFLRLSREDLEAFAQCFKATQEDYDFIDNRFPKIQTPPNPDEAETKDLYDARLKALAGLQPKTVGLVAKILAAESDDARRALEWEAVQAYFAELAQYWSEEEVLAWQKANPLGSDWLCEFAKVRTGARRQLDPVNHELALNWLAKKYNMLTEAELADAIFAATGVRINAATVKKRRERLGLLSKRSPGPPPKSQ